MHNLRLTNVVPGPDWGRIAPGELAAAAERGLLEKMLSLVFSAQARLLRTDDAVAQTGWSVAENAAHHSARAVNLLSQAATRLFKTYRVDTFFEDTRDAAQGERNVRVDVLATAAIARTDPDRPERESAAAAEREARRARLTAESNATKAYIAEMAARLRRYEPDWETPEQFAVRRDASWAAGNFDVPPTPSEAPPEKIAKIEEQVVGGLLEETTVPGIHESPPGVTVEAGQASPDLPAEAPRRKRGAAPGNTRARKTGRHTATAKAARAENRHMMREVRDLCGQAREIVALKSQPPSPPPQPRESGRERSLRSSFDPPPLRC